jgi:hypothetical protein
MTKVSNIVRGVMAEYGHHTYFNDRLKSGDRSIKVWGLSQAGYDELERRFQNAGFGTKQIETPKMIWNGRLISGGNLRIHVRETS